MGKATTHGLWRPTAQHWLSTKVGLLQSPKPRPQETYGSARAGDQGRPAPVGTPAYSTTCFSASII